MKTLRMSLTPSLHPGTVHPVDVARELIARAERRGVDVIAARTRSELVWREGLRPTLRLLVAAKRQHRADGGQDS